MAVVADEPQVSYASQRAPLVPSPQALTSQDFDINLPMFATPTKKTIFPSYLKIVAGFKRRSSSRIVNSALTLDQG